jgi:4-hydroxyproline epimerase
MSASNFEGVMRLRVIDSHTVGEPTRVVVSGGPQMPEKGAALARKFLREQGDWMRRCLIDEPRGFDAVVGAFLCEPSDESCVTGVVFFNNGGYLPSCIHGTIGVIRTLLHMGRIGVGSHRLETPVGIVTAVLAADGNVTVENVPCYRTKKDLVLEVPGYGSVTGDIAWGGNWFFLIADQGPPVNLAGISELMAFTTAVRRALDETGIRSDEGDLIDHVEVFAEPHEGVDADSQNFVLCPGGAYDRSPCGTGTSGKLACLAADGDLAEGEIFRQAGIVGTVFEGRYRRIDAERITPIITGRAWITAESEIIIEPDDPFGFGIGTEPVFGKN